MNKKFGFYFSKGFNLSFYSLKKCSFFTKLQLCFYSLLSLIGKFVFFLRPIFEIADMNLAAFVAESRNVCFPKIFQGTTKKRYVDLLFTEILTDILVFMSYGLLAALPISLMMMAGRSTTTMVIHYVLAIGALVPAYIFAINVAPAGFIASKTNGLDASDFLLNSKATMKGRKIATTLVYVIYDLIFAALFVGIYYGISYSLKIDVSNEVIGLVIFAIFAAVLLLCFFVLMPFKVAKLTNLYLIYRDGAKLTKSIAVKPVAGENLNYAPLFSEDPTEVQKLEMENKKEGK